MEDTSFIQAERIAGDWLQERIKTSYPIIGKGIVNQVCVVETDNRKVVVRMNDTGTYSCFIKEKWCIEQAAAVGIPGPEVLAIGIADKAAYMIQTFVEGQNGLDSTIPKCHIWWQLGEYVKLIHEIQVRGYGENLMDPAHGVFQSPPHAGSDGSWQGYVNYNISSLTEYDRLIELGVMTRTESKRVRKLFKSIGKQPFRFGLNHGDISLKNTIVNQSGQVSLLDWGSAEVSVVPHIDIIEIWNSQMMGGGPNNEEFKAFIDGYGVRETDLADMRPLWLLRAFDKLRWAIERRPELIKSYAAFAKQVVDVILH